MIKFHRNVTVKIARHLVIKIWKEHKKDFIDLLAKHNVNFIWHITKLSNLNSILKHKHLFSLNELKNKNINFNTSSNDLSKKLDIDKNTHDYVRFSFTINNPMFKKFLDRYPGDNFCILKMSVFDMISLDNVVFSNINAADKNALFFNDLDNFMNLDFRSFKIKNEITYNMREFKTSQSEIMILKQVPLDKLTIAKLYVQRKLP